MAQEKMPAGFMIRQPATVHLNSSPLSQPVRDQQLIQWVFEWVDLRGLQKTGTVQEQPCLGEVSVHMEAFIRLSAQDGSREIENEAGIIRVQYPHRTGIKEPLAL
jgi:predicted  nucleic acid-binding Zn ribbon protein